MDNWAKTLKRNERKLIAFGEVEAFFKRAGEIIGQARRTPRGQPEGWIISPEEREELRSIQERVYQFVYFGIKP